MHIGIFRIFYSTTYSLLLLFLIALLLISPADGIYQSYVNEHLWNVVFIAGAYVLTLIVAIFIYATRLYTTRIHLASIPKTYIPIRKKDVAPSVRRLITEGLARSAGIAYNAHPKDIQEAADDTLALEGGAPVLNDSHPMSRPLPAWSIIEHHGWSSPLSHDLPNLHYESVILELPHLLEAKAVSLAPPDPSFGQVEANNSSPDLQQIRPDPLAVALLQRPASMPLHEYLSHLSSLFMLQSDTLVSEFLAIYQHARFSTEPLSTQSFRSLISKFTILLETMSTPSPSALAALATSTPDTTPSTSNTPSLHNSRPNTFNPSTENLASSPASTANTAPYTPFQTPYLTPYPASLSSGHAGDRSSDDNDSGSERTAHTAWTRPGRRNGGSMSQYTASVRRPLERQSRRDSGSSGASGESEGSVIRRVVTGASGASRVSDGSVVRREDRGEEVLNLPVVFVDDDEGGENHGEDTARSAF